MKNKIIFIFSKNLMAKVFIASLYCQRREVNNNKRKNSLTVEH